ncbi:MAG TPA: response regulator transcription factor [Solirubrobacteraceae bacterium]|jgi:DNA-binding NarL/FixJ family response regulator|nr:response regulator transcription factor [Solirubrobacteraceae bacterium]
MDTLTQVEKPDADETIAGAPAAPLKVLIADDHPLVLAGLRRALEGHEDIEIAGEAHSGNELLALVKRRRPDVVLTDLRMPDVEGESCIARIAQSWPDVKIVVISACDDAASVNGALAAGARSYVVKSVSAIDIAAVVRQTRCGAVYHAPSGGAARACDAPKSSAAALTERETAILAAVAQGLTTKSIGGELWISEHTVKFHLTNIYRKLGVSNRSGAVRFALEHGLAA